MGGLRPIGSEKLQGMDKIRRIMEIARFNEVLPQSINEDKSTEYTLPLADGNTYAIVKEKQGYIIKLSLNESVTDYIEPMQNRKYFSSYSQALKKLNLMAKEYNTLYGNDEGTSLFTEQKKKFKLRLPKTNTETTPEPAPAPELAPAPVPAPAPAPVPSPAGDTGTELPPPPSDMGGDEFLPADASGDMGSDMPPAPEGMEDMGSDMPPAPEGMEDMGSDMPPLPDDMEDDSEGDNKKEEGTSFKIIQKLTGKLAQKIRKFNDKDEMDGNDVKYIINSILSALDVDVLDDDDLEEIMSRLEGDYDDEDKDEDEDEDEDVSLEEPSGLEDEDLPPPPEGGEMSEYNTPSLGDAVNRLATTTMADGLSKMSSGEMGEEYPKHGARSNQRSYNHFEHGTFGESKVDKIISKYFNITDEDVMINESKEIKRKEELEKLRERNVRGIKRLSENIKQERMALKFIEINPTSKLAGLTNKGNLVFIDGLNERKITSNGKVL